MYHLTEIMEKLMEIADKQATSEKTSQTTVNPDLFQKFMDINSVWDFHGISKGDYFLKSNQEKVPIIETYYKHMVNGEKIFFF